MKVVLWCLVLVLSGTILFLTDKMQDRPFTTSNVRDAYFQGCIWAAHEYETPNVQNPNEEGDSDPQVLCSIYADRYEKTLKELMEQTNGE